MTVIQSGLSEHVRLRTRRAPIRWAVIVAMIVVVVLSPEFIVRRGLYKPRLEDFILLTVAAVWFLRLPSRRLDAEPLIDGPPGNLVLTRIMVGLFYFATISIGVGTIAFQQPLIINDWMVLPMFARYWLTLQVGHWAREKMGQQVFLWALLLSLGLSGGVGVLQHFNLLGINDWLTPRYVHETQEIIGLELVRLGHPSGRVVGTHGEPRHYAYMMVVSVGLSSAILANLRARLIRATALVVLGISLAATAFTASRSATLSILIVSITATAMQLRKPRGIAKSMSLLTVIVVVVALGSQMFAFTAFEDRVMHLQSRSFQRSLHARIRDLREPFERALESPLIWLTGRGPSKAVMRTDSHNDFGWYFHRYGLPGLLLYVLLIFQTLKLSLQTCNREVDPLRRTISMLTFLTGINWLLFAMAENILKDSQLMSLNMLIIGACLGVNRTEQDA